MWDINKSPFFSVQNVYKIRRQLEAFKTNNENERQCSKAKHEPKNKIKRERKSLKEKERTSEEEKRKRIIAYWCVTYFRFSFLQIKAKRQRKKYRRRKRNAKSAVVPILQSHNKPFSCYASLPSRFLNMINWPNRSMWDQCYGERQIRAETVGLPWYTFKQSLNVCCASSERVVPEVVSRILDEFNKCDKQSPRMRSVDYQTFKKHPGIKVQQC